MDFQLTGRRALVTGGSRGIGRGIVEMFAHEGVDVLFCGRSAEAGEALAAALTAQGLAVAFVQADTDDPAALEALATRLTGSTPMVYGSRTPTMVGVSLPLTL